METTTCKLESKQHEKYKFKCVINTKIITGTALKTLQYQKIHIINTGTYKTDLRN